MFHQDLLYQEVRHSPQNALLAAEPRGKGLVGEMGQTLVKDMETQVLKTVDVQGNLESDHQTDYLYGNQTGSPLSA